MRVWLGLGLAIIALTFGGCNTTTNTGSSETVGSGVLNTETRTITEFASIELATSGVLEITQGDQVALTIEAEDNLLSLLTSEVKEKRLTLGTTPNVSFRPTKAITYRLSVIALEQITISGSGAVKIGTLNAPAFNLELNGSGTLALGVLTGNMQLVFNIGGSGSAQIDAFTGQNVTINLKGEGNVTLKGEVSHQQVSVEGTGRYDGEGLASRTAQVRIAGDGDVSLNVSDQLDVEVSGSGDVWYVGNPTVTRNITGSGNVQQK